MALHKSRNRSGAAAGLGIKPRSQGSIKVAIEKTVPNNATLCIVPEGVMLNYLTRRGSSIPYLAFLPSDLAMFSERRVADALAAHPPDVIIVYPKNTEEYGRGNFGAGYARQIAAWIKANYHTSGVIIVGPDSIFFLARNPATSTPSPPPR